MHSAEAEGAANQKFMKLKSLQMCSTHTVRASVPREWFSVVGDIDRRIGRTSWHAPRVVGRRMCSP